MTVASEPVLESAVAFEIMLLISAEVPSSFLRVLAGSEDVPQQVITGEPGGGWDWKRRPAVGKTIRGTGYD